MNSICIYITENKLIQIKRKQTKINCSKIKKNNKIILKKF